MFDTLHTTYREIVNCIGIVGYNESDIISSNNNYKNNNSQKKKIILMILI